MKTLKDKPTLPNDFSSPKYSAKNLFLSMKGEAKDLVQYQIYYVALTLCCL